MIYLQAGDVQPDLPNGDGTVEIDVATNNCIPDCAGGNLVHFIYRWTGTSYQPS